MSFDHDFTGVDPDKKGGYPKLPPGTYKFRIQTALSGQSANGNPNVALDCEVADDVEHNGKLIPHWVTFLPKDNAGAGISCHFLKVIGEPWEGKVVVEPENWVGKSFLGKVEDKKFISKRDGKTYTNSKIVGVDYPAADSLDDIFGEPPK